MLPVCLFAELYTKLQANHYNVIQTKGIINKYLFVCILTESTDPAYVWRMYSCGEPVWHCFPRHDHTCMYEY